MKCGENMLTNILPCYTRIVAGVSQPILVVVADKGARMAAIAALRGAGRPFVAAADLERARQFLSGPLAGLVIGDTLPDGDPADILRKVRVPSVVLAHQPGAQAARSLVASGALRALSVAQLPNELVSTLDGKGESPPDEQPQEEIIVVEAEEPDAATVRAERAEAITARTPLPKNRPIAEPVHRTTSANKTNDATGAEPASSEARRPASAQHGEVDLAATLCEELDFLKRANHYRVLKLTPEANEFEISDAFQRFADEWDPARLPADADAGMRATMSEMYSVGRNAFDVLINPIRREQYRLSLTAPVTGSGPPSTVPATRLSLLTSRARAGTRPPETAAKPTFEPTSKDLDATELFADLDFLEPLPEDPRLQQIRAYIRVGQAEQAQEGLDALLEDEPQNEHALALVHVVEALLGKERTQVVKKEVEKALEADPDCPEALVLQEHLAERRANKLRGILQHQPGWPSRRVVIEAIVLAFNHSALRDVVGTDALRMVLTGRYADMVQQPGHLDLQPLWEILKSQPGFSVDKAQPPLCRLKSWEPALQITIDLPAELGRLTRADFDRLAFSCAVPEGKLYETLRQVSLPDRPSHGGSGPQRSAPIAQRSAPAPRRQTPAPMPAQRAQSAAARGKAVAAAALAASPRASRRERNKAPPGNLLNVRRVQTLMAAAAALLVGSVYLTFLFKHTKTIPLKSIQADIPLVSIERSGDMAGGVLGDLGWLYRDLPFKKKQLDEVIRVLETKGITRFAMYDVTGRVLASAVASDEGTVIEFYP
jgi:hypothetical protein